MYNYVCIPMGTPNGPENFQTIIVHVKYFQIGTVNIFFIISNVKSSPIHH